MRYSNSAPSPTEVAEFVLTEDDAVRIEPAPEGKIALGVDNCARSANLEYWGRVELTPEQARAVGVELVRRAGAVEVRGTLGPDGRMRAEGDVA